MADPLQPTDPDYAARLRETIAGQPMMQLIGAEIVHALPGDVTVRLPHRDTLRQHHGYLHGGVTAMIADEACGLAALSLVAEDRSVVTTDLSVSFLRPGVGASYEARATVVRPGRQLIRCHCEVHALDDRGGRKLIGIAQASLMTLDKR